MNFNFISKTALFRGCTEEDVQIIAKQLNFRKANYKKGTIIFAEGSIVTEIGLVLYGSVQLEHNDIWGGKTILGIVDTGSIFAEAYACIPNEPMMINAVSNEDCEILFINVPKLLNPCFHHPKQHRLIQNLVIMCAQKNIQLSKRSLHTSPKTIRSRLFSYFSEQISAQGSNKIILPFDRQQLAEYLNLDRSALSKELGKMKKDGLIEYRKNIFEIKDI